MERGIPGVTNPVPNDSQQFQMAQQQIHPYSHLGSGRFHIRGEQTPKPWNVILRILDLWEGGFEVFSTRSQQLSMTQQ